MEYDPNQIPKLIKPIVNRKSKIVYGSRFLGRWEKMNFSFFFGNKLLTFATNLLFNSKLSDMETCYKAIHKNVLRNIRLTSNRFEIEAELTSKILKNRYKIHEIPIRYVAREKKKGKKIRWIDGVKSLCVLFKVKCS